MLATDGAARTAKERGVAPDIISGDFDSISQEGAQLLFPDAECIRTQDQNFADLEKAILLCRARGAESIQMTGTGGGRPDHSLTAFALLLRYHREIPISIVEEAGMTIAVTGECKLAAAPGDTLSVISFDGLSKVTLRGVAWELTDHSLQIGTHGVSNVASEAEVFVKIEGGAALVCHLKKFSERLG